MSNQLVHYLHSAAIGKITARVVLWLIWLQMPNLLSVLLPLSLFLTILLVYGRMYADSEMTVLFACGVSRAKLMRIAGAIALGAFTFTMDSLPGTPQIQNIIPTTFFNTNTWAAPWLGVIGAVFILTLGLLYLDRQRKRAEKAGEGYGINLVN